MHVQQTSTSQGSPFIRGLTGQQVVTLIDGVRFNNATFRPGANQYSALIDSAFAGQVEIVRGPNGAQIRIGFAWRHHQRPDESDLERAQALRREWRRRRWEAAAVTSRPSRVPIWPAGPRTGDLRSRSSGRRGDDLRTGGGIDSHSVATRLLGLPSAVLGDRLQDTAFGQVGVRATVAIDPRANDVLTAQYIRGQQDDASRYDQLDGGVGNLINRFDPQTLDFLTVRYDRLGLPLFDALSATLSFNGQRDDREYQSVNNTKLGLLSPISEEHNRTEVFGYQVQASRRCTGRMRWPLAEKSTTSSSTATRQDLGYNAAAGGYIGRGRRCAADVPNGARYRRRGLFCAGRVPACSRRSSTPLLAVRYSRFRYGQSTADNPVSGSGPTVPTYSRTFGDVTFNTGLALALTRDIALTAAFARGFRAPNVSDFGSIGLSGIGFEVSPDKGMRMGAAVAPFSADRCRRPTRSGGWFTRSSRSSSSTTKPA